MKKIAKIAGSILLLIVFGYVLWLLGQSIYYYLGPSERLLSDTGYIAVESRKDAAARTHSVTPKFPFWSDGAIKNRYIYLPPDERIDNSSPDRWNFPVGTRIWKDFHRDGVLVETRMLYKHGKSVWDWDMAAYAWRRDLTDADKLIFGRTNVRGTPHDIPSPTKCTSCHGSGQTRRPLGLTAMQLPWEDDVDLSIEKLIESSLFTHRPIGPYKIPGDAITKLALGYLDTNCGTCHHKGSTYVDEKISLRLNLTTDSIASVSDTNAYRTMINQAPMISGLDTIVYVLPGNSTKSFAYRRMTVRDGGIWQMPPIATEEVDIRGAEIIENWINAMRAEPK